MKKLAMKMLSLLLVLSLLLPTCVFAQPGQNGDGTPGTQGAAMEDAGAPTGGGNSDEDADAPTGGGNGDGTSKDENGGGNGGGDTKDVNGGSVTQSTTSEKTTTFTEGEDGDGDADVSEEPTVATVSIAVAAEDDGISQEELLEGYLYSISGLYGEGAAVFRAPSAPLPEVAQDVYNALAPEIEEVANGTRDSAKFMISNTWTKPKADWGITGSVISSGAITAEASAAIREKINMDALLQRLLSTMPYKLYWFDKTTGGLAMEYGISVDSTGNNVTVQDMVVYMTVAAAYTNGTTSTGGTTPPKTYKTGVDITKTGATSTAVSNAQKIVTDNSSKRDYEKLKAYLSEICNRVEYNHAAAGSSWSGGYGDPWQLIYVFDNDTTNKVVCEGYAKAFKYLCDLSTFNDTDLSCYLVTGTMKGGTGEGGSGAGGGHMWNVVHIEGNNYLVDVTNCDTGTIGATDKLFLCGVREDVASEKYTATNATAGVSNNVEYEYDAATRGGYTADELKLSGVTYTPPAQETPVITTSPTASGITYGETLNNSTLTYGVAKVGSTVVSGTFAWRDTTIAPEVKDSETTQYEVVFTPNDTASYENATCKVTLTVYAKNLTDVAVGTIADQGYTGSQIKPPVTVTGDGDKTLVLNKDYTVDYGANNTVGTNTGSVTVMAKSGGNYTFGNKTVNFTIVAGTSTISITGNPSKTYDGNAVANPAVDKTGSTGTVSYTYYIDSSCTTETTTANSGAASNGAAPKNAGDYWVKATVAADSNYGSATSDAKAFTISKRDIGGATIVFGPQGTYNGYEQSVALSYDSIKDGTKILIGSMDYTVKSGNKATDVGNTTLVIEGKGNYTGEASGTWSLKKATPQDIDFNIPSLSSSYDYTGNPWSVLAPTLESPKTKAGEVTVYYEGTSGTTYAPSTTAPTDVGSYKVTFNVTGGQNFNAASGLNIGTLKINPKDVSSLTAVAPDQNTVLNVGSFVEPTIKGVKNEVLAGVLKYTITAANGATAVTDGDYAAATGSLATLNKDKAVSVSYTFTPSSGNYTGSKTGSFTVTAKDIEFTVNGAAASVGNTLTVKSSPVYGDDWSDIVKIKDGVTITATAGAGTDTDPSHFTLKQTGKPGVGSQAYTLAYNGTINGVTYSDVTVLSGTVTVAQKDVTITGLGAANKVYDGNDTAAITGTAAVAGKVGSDDVTVTGGTATFDNENVGAGKTVTFSGYGLGGTAAGNYNLTAQPANVTAEITARKVTITNGITATNRPYEKNNTTVNLNKSTLTFTNLVTGETLDANVPTTGTVDNANVGTGKNVTYSGVTLIDSTGMASNYKLVGLPTVTVDITQAAAPAAPTGLNGVKGNALSTVTLPSGWTWVSGSTVMNTVGSQTFKADYNDAAGNHMSATNVDVAVNVMDKTDVGGKISFNDGTLVYTGAGQKYETASISGITAGTGVTWTYVYTAGTGTLDGGLPKTVGTYTATVTYEDSLNYGTKSVTLTITQATPTGAPKFTKITSSGKTLGDAALVKTVSGPGDGFSVAGTVEWVDGSGAALADSTSVEANKSYGWKFTPTDSNYKSISGSVVVYTVRRVSHSGGAAADSAAAAAAQPTVYSGSRGESVKMLQEKLNAKGYNAGSVDGIFGKNTQAAVIAFQKANGLAADGIVGKLTWAKLYDTTAALPAASTATGTQPMVYRGSRGDAVRRLQELLNKKGFDCGAADGIFGSKTYAAVVAFQKANGLSADGIVGPLTWGKLG